MSRDYKNILQLRDKAYGDERRKNLTKEILSDSSPFPNPLEYKDIDEEFKRWVDEDLDISFDGKKLPTIALFSNQRFSEYMQSWANVDNKKNLILNFKTITRENNPKAGTIVGNTRNIPGEPTFLMKRVEAFDRANRRYFIDYRVKQPFAVDLIYTLSIVVSKYELLNEFNLIINDKFKAIDCYIRPKGHFIPMKLNDISYESEYSIDDRQFYSQSYNITVMGYIMPEDSFIVEEHPELKFMGFEGDTDRSYADIEELPCGYKEESPYAYAPINLSIHFSLCDTSYKFKIDTDFHAKNIVLTNVRNFVIYVNDKETVLDENFEVKNGDEIKIKKLTRPRSIEESIILIEGFNPSKTHKKAEGTEIEEIEYK